MSDYNQQVVVKRTIYGPPVPPHYVEKLTELEYRGFVLSRTREHLHWLVQRGPGDTEVPHKLTGRWTNLDMAKRAIDKELERQAQNTTLEWEKLKANEQQ